MASYKGPLDYIDVATRIIEFREKFPQGSLQSWRDPYVIEVRITDTTFKSFMVYSAAAYRSPDDELPGIGWAYEPIPGPTNFTRDSELQNAETAAWGRAMVAALAVDTRKGIASSEDVRNRAEKSPEAPAVTYTPEQIQSATEEAQKVLTIETVPLLKELYDRNQVAGLLNVPVDGQTLIARLNTRKIQLEAN